LDCSFKEAVKRTEIELDDTVSRIKLNIKVIKNQILDLERRISTAEQVEESQLQNLLRLESEELNILSDSIVVESRKAWGKYNELTKLCESQCVDQTLLETIRGVCRELEVIAADLLCYSLGH
jgi:hypothetical protein